MSVSTKNQTVTVRKTLTNKRGLHARASNKFVACANQFDAEITVKSHNDVCADLVIADSVMELLLLGSAYGEDVTIAATGPDADDAIKALAELIDDRFGEDS